MVPSSAAQKKKRPLKGNLAPKNPPKGMVPPPPPTTPPPPPKTPPPRRVQQTVATPQKAAGRGKVVEKSGQEAARPGEENNVEEKKPEFKPPTTFFSHAHHYYEPKRVDPAKLRSAAESTYGRRGRMSMSRARDVAIAGSALRSRPRTPSPSRDSRDAMRAKKEAKAKAIRAAIALERKEAKAKKDEMYAHKRRVMRALDVEREELPDGSIMFRFSEKPLTAKEERALISEEEAGARDMELLHNHPDEYQPTISYASSNVVSRWTMTVKFLASTLSLKSAAFYVLTTPFRAGFWTLAYTLRLLWWLCSGRMLPGRAAKRAKATRFRGGGGGGGGGGSGGGGGGGAFAAIDEEATRMEKKQARAEKSAGIVNGRDMRNVLLS